MNTVGPVSRAGGLRRQSPRLPSRPTCQLSQFRGLGVWEGSSVVWETRHWSGDVTPLTVYEGPEEGATARWRLSVHMRGRNLVPGKGKHVLMRESSTLFYPQFTWKHQRKGRCVCGELTPGPRRFPFISSERSGVVLGPEFRVGPDDP